MISTIPRACKAKSLLVTHMEVDFLSICKINREIACFLVGHKRGQIRLVLNLLLFWETNADKDVIKNVVQIMAKVVKMKLKFEMH